MTVISMFNKGSFERRYTYSGEKNEPTMIINNHAAKASALIPLPAAYKYNEPESRDQGKMIEAFNMLREVDQSEMAAIYPSFVVGKMMQKA